jgi:guanylate kinase
MFNPQGLIGREGEEHGVNYFYRSVEEFKQKIEKNAFLEYVQFNDNYYGTEIEVVEEIQNGDKICLVEIELQGSQKVQQLKPEWNYIFIFPPSPEALEQR